MNIPSEIQVGPKSCVFPYDRRHFHTYGRRTDRKTDGRTDNVYVWSNFAPDQALNNEHIMLPLIHSHTKESIEC